MKNLFMKSISNALPLVFLLLIFLGNDWFTGSYFSQKFILSLGVLFSLYWSLSIFVFLFKRSLYTSYTVVIQRYWKRTLYLFWGLELFLFGVYIYLVLVAPTEVEWLLDQPQLFKSNWWFGTLFFNKTLVTLTIILVFIVMQYSLLNGNWLFLIASALTATTLISSVLFEDFAQSFTVSTYFSGVSWGFDLDSGLWSMGLSCDKTRPLAQYVFLLTLLKYWHTVFIAGFWLVSVMFINQSPYIGQGALASNKQNAFFLFGFSFLWLCLLFKYLSNITSEYVYDWFFVNPRGFSFAFYQNTITPLCALVS